MTCDLGDVTAKASSPAVRRGAAPAARGEMRFPSNLFVGRTALQKHRLTIALRLFQKVHVSRRDEHQGNGKTGAGWEQGGGDEGGDDVEAAVWAVVGFAVRRQWEHRRSWYQMGVVAVTVGVTMAMAGQQCTVYE
ncbi:Protein of unknown function [Gryllus bimaculatus]|nr:Protein of unknown function [Gryllus bimaculatus]